MDKTPKKWSLALLSPVFALSGGLAYAQESDDAAIEEIVVTGSFIKRQTADSPSPLSVVSRADIEDIGATTISDIVNTLTFNSGSANFTNAFNGGDSSTGSTNVNLRNLGLGSTLVLVNGRRYVAANNDTVGNAFVNTSLIAPTIALERVEIVKDGSSALYGSEAVAGVVNFITRDSFEGFELDFNYGSDFETGEADDRTIGAIWGVQNEQGGFTASLEYLDRDALTINDRLDDFGGTGISSFGNPGSFAFTNSLAFGGSFSDPDCGTPVSSINLGAAPGTGPGSLCLYDFGPFFNLVGQEKRTLGHVSSHYNISDTTEFYADVGFAFTEFERGNSLFPNLNINAVGLQNPGLQNAIANGSVDPANITGPDDAAVFFRGRILGGSPDTAFEDRPIDTRTKTSRDQFRVVSGIRGELPFINDSWTFDVTGTRSESFIQSRNTDSLSAPVASALQGFGGLQCDPGSATETAGSGNAGIGNCFFFNPFASSLINPDGSPQTDPALQNSAALIDSLVGEARSTTDVTQSVFDVVATGDIFDLAAGPVGLAVGFQWRRDEVNFDADNDSNEGNFAFLSIINDFSGAETVAAGFFELAIPLHETLDLQIAGRYEEFRSLNEDSFDPKASLLWRALPDLTFRGSIGTSFRAPSLLQRFGTQTQLLNTADPFSGATLAFRPQISQGNPNLQPEDSTAWNIGFSYAPTEGALAGLSVDVDYYNYEYDDLITVTSPQEVITADALSRCPQGINIPGSATFNAAIPLCGVIPDANGVPQIVNDPAGGGGLPDILIRDDFGNFLSVQPPFDNAQGLDTSGIDLAIGYGFDVNNIGTFKASLAGSWTAEYDVTLADGTEIDGVGSRNFANSVGRPLPEFQANFSLGLQRNAHSGVVFVRYIDSYIDDQLNPSTLRRDRNANDIRINSFTTVDVQYSYSFDGPAGSSNTFTLGGKNVGNRTPPQVNVDGGFDPFTHDPRGALWYAKISLGF